MIGQLPAKLNDRAIRSDFRVALLIFQAFNDPDLNDYEKIQVMLECLYVEDITEADMQECINQAIWYLDGGQEFEQKSSARVMDWEQDEQIIFSAVNKVAGTETRCQEHIHWWTFLGYFNEIGEGLLSTVMNIRQKKAKGKKLEKYEQEFYAHHKTMVKLAPKLSADEQAEVDRLNKLLGGG